MIYIQIDEANRYPDVHHRKPLKHVIIDEKTKTLEIDVQLQIPVNELQLLAYKISQLINEFYEQR